MSQDPRTSGAHPLLHDLAEETSLLDELAAVTEAARGLAPGAAAFGENVARQASLCDALSTLRERRRALLERGGHRAQDFLLALLAELPRELHPDAVGALDRQLSAARAADRQLAINREFFGVLLATVEDTLAGVAGEGGRPVTYDARGERAAAARAIRLDRQVL